MRRRSFVQGLLGLGALLLPRWAVGASRAYLPENRLRFMSAWYLFRGPEDCQYAQIGYQRPGAELPERAEVIKTQQGFVVARGEAPLRGEGSWDAWHRPGFLRVRETGETWIPIEKIWPIGLGRPWWEELGTTATNAARFMSSGNRWRWA